MKTAILPFKSKKIGKKYLITNNFGNWVFLNENEFKNLSKFNIEKIEDKLLYSKIAINDKNYFDFLQNFREINLNLFQGPSLFIINVNPGCNFRCIYCHASKNLNNNSKLKKENSLKIIEHIFNSNSDNVVIEFQGGEPLSNFDIIELMVNQLNKFNDLEGKKLSFTIVSNLSLLTSKQINFISKHNISICTSLDGPRLLHDKQRIMFDGKGTYDLVISKIKLLKDSNIPVSALPTITKNSLNYHKEIIDEYIKQNINYIHLRFLNNLGDAEQEWDKIGYSAEEFINFWKKSITYIFTLNKDGFKIKERTVEIILKKLYLKKDPMYTEMMSPCGAGRSQILYNYDGSVYTCDEARMINDDLFKLGDFTKSGLNEILSNPNMIEIIKSSMIELYDPSNVYSQWIGTCPVVNYAETGSILAKTSLSLRNKVYEAQFDYIFSLIESNSELLNILFKLYNIYPHNNSKDL